MGRSYDIPARRSVSRSAPLAPTARSGGLCGPHGDVYNGHVEKERKRTRIGPREKMLDSATKQRIIGEYQAKPGDSGSTEVQVALLSERIRGLTDHLRRNHKDHATRRGLLKLVGQRRRLLRYLANEDISRYRTVIGRLGLRR